MSVGFSIMAVGAPPINRCSKIALIIAPISRVKTILILSMALTRACQKSVHGYDFILSTQVLEHVQSPTIYLDECHRVLSPNGHLLLTTHGIFEDHGCPYDYWRWTIYGLGKIVERAGFKIKALKKITTGPRAAIFLAEQQFQTFRSSLTGPYGTVISLGIRAVQRIGSRRLHNVCDTSFKGWRVVDAEEAGHSTYIVIGVLAARR